MWADELRGGQVADRDKKREFVSGFSGSAGTAVIGLSQAWLWTDSRYLLQAKQELDPVIGGGTSVSAMMVGIISDFLGSEQNAKR
jgi:cytoskeletal protein RodZ